MRRAYPGATLRNGGQVVGLSFVLAILACGVTPESHPVAPKPRPARIVAATASASAHAPPAVTIEGERLAPIEAAAFSVDRDELWVRRADGSRETWGLDGRDLLRRYSEAEWERERAVDGPLAIEPSSAASGSGASGSTLRLATAAGVDDAPLGAWAKGLGAKLEREGGELVITAPTDVTLSASPDGQIVVAEKAGDAYVLHRQARTRFKVGGWNRGFSSHYGYAGDSTTWTGSVGAVFGPARDQLVLSSLAQRSISFVFAASRLYDARTGKVVAALHEETCQSNRVIFSPFGKYIVRERCHTGSLLVSDGARGTAGPDLPADSFLAFKSDESAVAGAFDGSARVFALGDPKPRYVVPGPSPAVLDVELVHQDLGIAILRGDGLDLWDLKKGMLVQHVDSVPQTPQSLPMQRSGTGRFIAFGEEGAGESLPTVVVDTETGALWRETAAVAVDPVHDTMARVDGKRLVWIDLPSRAALPGPIALTGALQTMTFSRGGVLVAQLRDCSVWAFDGPGRLRFKTPPLDRRGCQTIELTGEGVRVSAESDTHEVALRDGARLAPGDGPTELEAWSARPRPAFTPAAFEEEARTRAKGAAPPSWRSRPGLFVGGMQVPVVTREKDGRSIWLHAFPWGRGRAAIVIDDEGRWDANELGAALVRVGQGAKGDERERRVRRLPGLLAAFCRGE